jgi:colicin import membrane protein
MEGAGLMARKLKAYQTSLGFFDLAVAAPSMKAAAEAWGSRTNLFQQGLARETHDPAVIAATMAKPGVVLRRPVGSNAAFREYAALPEHLPREKIKETPSKSRPKTKPPRALSDEAAREAALSFEREQRRRESARQREEAAREKDRIRRERAIAKAEATLEKATHEHEAKVSEIEKARAALDKRSQTEDARWEKQKEKFERAVSRARGVEL